MRQVTHFNLAGMRQELEEISHEMNAPGFWDDVDKAQRVNQRAKQMEDKIANHNNLLSRCDDVVTLMELAEEMQDEESVKEVGQEIAALRQEADTLRLETLLKGKYDSMDAILSIHAGAGGTEAQDWAQMLYRMYTRWAEKHNYTVQELDFLDGDEAGVKSVTFQVSGLNAYGFLRAEKGVHRLVRISPFDSQSRRHTSFTSLDVTPLLDDSIEVEINKDDIRIDIYRASGAGGQHVNKTSSAIRITHMPSGIVVQCQNERSQTQNKETAFRMLRSKLAEIKEREFMEQMQDIKGEVKNIEWGSQIRSYVFQPYTMVKDHRTNYEMGDVGAVMDGNLDGFITAYLQMS